MYVVVLVLVLVLLEGDQESFLITYVSPRRSLPNTT